jgi:hypothetical protein
VIVGSGVVAAGFFSSVFGIDSVAVKASAAARAGAPGAVNYVSPITVDDNNPQLICGPSCFGSTVRLAFNPDGDYPGVWTNAGVINLQGSGKPSNSTIAG